MTVRGGTLGGSFRFVRNGSFHCGYFDASLSRSAILTLLNDDERTR